MENLSTYNRYSHCQHLINECAQLGPVETQEKVKEFILHLWPTLELDPECGSVKGFWNWLWGDEKSEKTMAFLQKKLTSILLDHPSQSTDWKIVLCFNSISNFNISLSAAVDRIKFDIKYDAEFRETFNLDKDAQIKSITPLGEETHNRGQIPLLVIFEDGKRIVYKPRSMIAEELVCGHKNSLFKVFDDLGVYIIYNKDNYGYSEFLDNTRDPMTTTELNDYVKRLWDMELICKKLRISDIHSGNIIVGDNKPYIIDMEVILLPRSETYDQIGTNIYSGSSAGFRFTDDEDSKNIIRVGAHDVQRSLSELEYAVDSYPSMIYRKKELEVQGKLEVLQHERRDLNDLEKAAAELAAQNKVAGGLSKHDKRRLQKMEAEITRLRSELEYGETRLRDLAKGFKKAAYSDWTTLQRNELKRVKALLKEHQHRIVLIGTMDLTTLINIELSEAKEGFIRKMDEGLKSWGFKSLVSASLPSILSAFEADFRNNDVPIFYHDPKNHAIFYNGIKIGSK
jgi:lantibiotic modifying enzyme